MIYKTVYWDNTTQSQKERNCTPEEIADIEARASRALTPDDIVQAMDDLFNAVAHAKHYDNRVTCVLRAGYPGPFHAEGLAFATWMDNCNAAAYAMLQEVQGGTRQMPQTITEALALLPAAPW